MPQNTHRLFLALAVSAAIAITSPSAGAQPGPTAGGGLNQIGPRIIDRNRIDQSPSTVVPTTGHVASGKGPAAAVPPNEDQTFILHDLTVDGGTALPSSALRETWAARLGKNISIRTVYAISDAIGQMYADAGYALYLVSVPKQDFRTGHVRIHVTEGYVASATIEGNTDGADLSILQAQAARIVGERPLRQATLERNILLMNEIAGLKVGSGFEPVPNQPGAVVLKLTVKRTTFEYGLDFDNGGNALLARTQLAANVAVNSLFREGDRTQLVFGAPSTIERYQYYGLTHVEPLGTNGGKIGINLGELVTNGVHNTDSGTAQLFDLTASYPLIRRVRESLTIATSFDLLNSNDALLGQSLTDERTRVVRLALSWAKQDAVGGGLDGLTALSGTVSQGIDGLGARRSFPFGGPDFTKFNARLSRTQELPWNLVLRAKLAGQYAAAHLPATEQFAYGGTDFGQAFGAASVIADSGAAAALEIAYRLPQSWFPSVLSGNELFSFADYGRFWNRNTAYQLAHDRAASAGFGVRTRLLDKFAVQLGAANAIMPPVSQPNVEHWRFLVQVTGKF